MEKIDKSKAINVLVKTAVQSFATGFCNRHEAEFEDPNGCLNMKIHNIFIAVLGEELQYYTALCRSFDSSLGNMLEELAMNIAQLSFEVRKEVQGHISREQTVAIAELLEKYKRHEKKPEIQDYSSLRNKRTDNLVNKRHDSDYYLVDKETNRHYLIELKIGGDLDNKKARSEKEAILEQYAILSNNLEPNTKIDIYFATAYNRFGEGKEWKQGRVKQFFADKELLIGKDFWNFVCKMNDGYELVLRSYKENSHYIKETLESIKKTYLG